MQDLLNIKNELIGGVEVQAVSARELYLGLGLMTNKWSRWAAKNIAQNEFFIEGIGFIQLPKKSIELSPNPTQDFAITIDFAVSLISFAKSVSSKVKMDMLTALGASDRVCVTSRAEIEFLDMLEKVIEPMSFTMDRQVSITNKKGTKYRIDAVINELNMAIEYDEEHHQHSFIDDETRQNEIENGTDLWFVRLSSGESHLFNIGLIMKEIVLYSEVSSENLYL